jgi:hypothetical protein
MYVVSVGSGVSRNPFATWDGEPIDVEERFGANHAIE